MTPNALLLIASMLALGALALGILFYLGTVRLPMIVKGEVRIKDVAISRDGWPEREKQVSNAFDNQFQLPVLFYVAAIVALTFGPTLLEVLLAWVFVILRFIHAYIHVTDNHVTRRFWTYTAGLLVLCALWLDLAIRLVLIALGAA